MGILNASKEALAIHAKFLVILTKQDQSWTIMLVGMLDLANMHSKVVIGKTLNGIINCFTNGKLKLLVFLFLWLLLRNAETVFTYVSLEWFIKIYS